MNKELWASDDYFPMGLEHSQRLVTNQNYYGKIIEKTYHVYKKLDIVDTDTLLDIGSGLGDVAKNFSKIVEHVYCCDINQNFLNMAEINCQDKTNMSFHKITNSITPLNFLKDTSITKAFANAVFVHCHTNVLICYLKELHRVLKNDGLFLTQYCTESSKSIFIQADKNYIESTINELNFNIIQSEKFSTIHDENFTGINLLLSK